MVFNRRLTQEERDALTFEQFLDYMAWLASLEDSADSDEREREREQYEQIQFDI